MEFTYMHANILVHGMRYLPGKTWMPFLVHSTFTVRLQMVNYSGYKANWFTANIVLNDRHIVESILSLVGGEIIINCSLSK